MHQQLLLYALVLAVVIAALPVVARRVRVISPIRLLVAGAFIAFAPGMPQLVLDPEPVLLTLLPLLICQCGHELARLPFQSSPDPLARDAHRVVRIRFLLAGRKALETLPTRCQPAARAAIGSWHADRREHLAFTRNARFAQGL